MDAAHHLRASRVCSAPLAAAAAARAALWPCSSTISRSRAVLCSETCAWSSRRRAREGEGLYLWGKHVQ